MRRSAIVVAVPFTLVSGLAFCLFVAGIALTFYYRPTVEAQGSGGIGAVSADAFVPIVLTLLFVTAAVFLNVAVAPHARRRGRAAIRLRYAHLAVTLLTLTWPGVVLILWMLFDRCGVLNQLDIMAACAAAVSAFHFAFGVFVITVLRRGVS